MKKWINIFLLAEAVLCIVLCIVGGVSSNLIGDIFSFPFTQLGDAIRALSLSGNVGNAIAWCVYVGICLIPIIIGIAKLIKHTFKAEDGLLFVIGGVLFMVMYYMINTWDFSQPHGITMGKDMTVAVLGATMYSVIIGYVILVAVRKVRNAHTNSLKNYLNVILFVVNVVIVYATFGSGLNELFGSLVSVAEANMGFEEELLMTKVFLCVRYAMDVILNLMSIGIIIAIQHFLEKLDFDNLSDVAIRSARKISWFCALAVASNIVMYIVYNVLQIILASKIYVIKSTINIPFISVIAMLVFMIMAQFVLGAKKIKDENDMFI